jgi:hypothetical protein
MRAPVAIEKRMNPLERCVQARNGFLRSGRSFRPVELAPLPGPRMALVDYVIVQVMVIVVLVPLVVRA